MDIPFVKMHGCGNDYIYIRHNGQLPFDPSALAVKLSDRRKSIGGDGIILIGPSDVADASMRIFNTDGSEGKMCGNGIRCVGKYLYDRYLTTKTTLTVETASGIKTLHLKVRDGKVDAVTVDMGKADVTLAGERAVAVPLAVGGKTYTVTCVSMGNPHCVVFCDDLSSIDLAAVGPAFEKAPVFSDGVNTEFVQVTNKTTLKMRVWERGSGETAACGTGACAAAVAAVENGHCEKNTDITVRLCGGDLTVRVTDDTVRMTGDAVTVYNGVITV